MNFELLSFGASRIGFYPSVRAAQAFILRCEPHKLLTFVTYSAVPARRLSFAHPSLNLRSSFAHPSSHTQLRQLADFPSLRRILNFELVGRVGLVRLLGLLGRVGLVGVVSEF